MPVRTLISLLKMPGSFVGKKILRHAKKFVEVAKAVAFPKPAAGPPAPGTPVSGVTVARLCGRALCGPYKAALRAVVGGTTPVDSPIQMATPRRGVRAGAGQVRGRTS